MTVELAAAPAPGSPPPLASGLAVRGLTAGYGRRTVIHDIDLSVGAGETVVLLGRNGAGKSTTLMAIAGFVPGASGVVEVDGRPLAGPPYARARSALSLVIKGRSLFPTLSVRDNLDLAGVSVGALLEIFPQLAPRVNVPAGQLSGGEQQLVAVGRALLRPASVILLDELTFGLSPATSSQLINVVTREAAARGLAVLAVEQHLHIAERLADRVIVLGEGRVRLALRRDELAARSDEVEHIYLGRSGPEEPTTQPDSATPTGKGTTP
jgi:branched-chain amino acid transport system ATP-binding protein